VFRVKSCPRCVGDLYLENLTGVHEWTCLQCGHRSPACVTTSAAPSKAEFKARRFDTAADADLMSGTTDEALRKATAKPQIGLPLSA
jgi:hypothetical protein